MKVNNSSCHIITLSCYFSVLKDFLPNMAKQLQNPGNKLQLLKSFVFLRPACGGGIQKYIWGISFKLSYYIALILLAVLKEQ